jgi:hypothetical protein
VAVKKLNRARIIIIYGDILIIDAINMISLSKLIDGGAAIFADNSRNHHMLNVGQMDNIPLVR